MTPVTGRSLTIAYVIDDLAVGGAQKQLNILTGAFPPRIRPVVCCLSRHVEPFGSDLGERGIAVRVFRRHVHHNPLLPATLARVLRAERVDIVHGWLDASNVYAFAAAKLIGVPPVLSLQSDRLRLRGLRARILIAMLRSAPCVTVNSASGRALLTDTIGVQADRAVRVPNWIAPRELPVGAHDEGPPVIGFIGRLVTLKRVDALIDAFAMLRERGSAARLVIVGDGPERAALESQARDTGVAEKVAFRGTVADVLSELEHFSCMVIPSEFEGLPNVALEALASGVPIIARPVGDLPSLVRDGQTGRLAAGPGPGDLATAIEALLNDTALRRAVREAGPALVRAEFSVGRAIDTLLPLYEKLSQKKGR